MNQKEAARYIGISVDTLQRYTSSNRITVMQNSGEDWRELHYEEADCDRLRLELGIASIQSSASSTRNGVLSGVDIMAQFDDDFRDVDFGVQSKEENLSQEEAADYLSIKADTLRAYTRQGRISAKQVHSSAGRRLEYRLADAERLKDELSGARGRDSVSEATIEPMDALEPVEAREWPQPPTPKPLKNRLLLTLADCEQMTGWNRRTLLAAIAAGTLNARLFQGDWCVRPSDLEATVQNLFNEPLHFPVNASRAGLSPKRSSLKRSSKNPELSPACQALARNIVSFVNTCGVWRGIATELLLELNAIVPLEDRNLDAWPRTPIALGVALSRTMPLLERNGIECYRALGHAQGRILHLRKQNQLALLYAT